MKLRLLHIAFLLLLLVSTRVAAQSWTHQPNMKLNRAEATAIEYQGELYVFNGFSRGLHVGSSVEKYNPNTKQWTLLGNTSVSHGNAVTHTSPVLVNDEVWLLGGRIGAHPGLVTTNVWIYNFASNTWRTGPKLPVPMAGSGAAVVNNKIHLFGGMDAYAECDVDFHYVYDIGNPASGWQSITSTAAMPSARNHFSTIVLNNIIYAIGGNHGHDRCPGVPELDVKLVNTYNPATNTWGRAADLPFPESHNEPSTFVYNGFIYMVGGFTTGNKVVRFDPAKNQWEYIVDLPDRLLAPVARIYDDRLVVAGGGVPITANSNNLVRSIGLNAFKDKATNFTSSGTTSQTTNTNTGAGTASNTNTANTGNTGNTGNITTVTNSQGLIVLEAEDFQATTSAGSHQWQSSNLPGSSGSKSMHALPNSGSLKSGAAASPSLSYTINFGEAGTYWVWIRGWGDELSNGVGFNDSVHAGLNGSLATSADKIDGFPAGWNWSNRTRDGTRATINVPNAGNHTFNLWMREDGFAVDKIILSKNANYTPTGTGESTAQTDDTPVASDSNTGTTNTANNNTNNGTNNNPAPTPVVANKAPVVNAGANASVMQNSALNLNGSATDDALPNNTLTYSWSKLNGPGNVDFNNASNATTFATFSEAGTYAVALTVSDGELSASDTIVVTVDALVTAASNPTPVSSDVSIDVIAIEAEDYFTKSAIPTHQWVNSNLNGASGNASMITTPNSGTLKPNSSASPMMGYLVNFTQPGKYYLWIRGWGDENSNGAGFNDSIHAGFNNTLSSTADKIDGFPSGWHWSRRTRDGAAPAFITIPTAGTHMVNLWMREDGFAVDKFLLTQSESYVPTGTGPDVIHTVIANNSTDNANNAGHANNSDTGGDTSADNTSNSGTTGNTSNTGNTNNASNPDTTANAGNNSSPSEPAGNNNDNNPPATPTASTTTTPLSASTAWEMVQTVDGSAIEARHESSAITVNGRLYLMGGRGMRAVQSFTESDNFWTTHGTPPVLMHHFQPVAIGSKIYVIGAMKNDNFPSEQTLENVYIFDTDTHTWTIDEFIPADRLRSSIGVATYNNKIYLVGGNLNGHAGPSVNWFDEYDPVSKQWRVLPDAPNARDHIKVAVANGKLVVAGGRRSKHPNVFGDPEPKTDLFNFTTQAWETTADNIPTLRSSTMTVAIDDEVIVIGGSSGTQSVAHAAVEALNVISGKWRQLQPLLLGRFGGGAAVLNNKIHVVAGSERRGVSSDTITHETLIIDQTQNSN